VVTMGDEEKAVQRLQELTAETTLEECEKADLWAFAKARGLADASEWPGVTKAELVERVRAYFAKAADAAETSAAAEEPEVPETSEALVYAGPLSETRIRGVGVVRRGQVFTRAETCPRIWRRLMGWPGMEPHEHDRADD